MSERKALICMLRRDLPTPSVKSRLDRCNLCRESIWVSASSPKAEVFYCLPCASDTLGPNDKLGAVTQRQRDDIRKARWQ